MAIFDLDGSVEAERKPLVERIGWLEQGIRLAIRDLEKIGKGRKLMYHLGQGLAASMAEETDRVAAELRKTLEGPEGLTLGPCYPGSPDDERGTP